MKIYFDDILIDENAYAGLTKNGQLFDGNFKLGTTICETYTLTINKEDITEIPEKVKIYEKNVLVKTLYVDSFKENDFTIELSLADYMIRFNFPYDASQIMVKEEAE